VLGKYGPPKDAGADRPVSPAARSGATLAAVVGVFRMHRRYCCGMQGTVLALNRGVVDPETAIDRGGVDPETVLPHFGDLHD